jgi:signal transduction histidine kinase
LNYHNQIEDRDNAIKFLSNENEVKNQENKMQRLYIYIFVCLAILILSFSYLYYKQVKLLSDLNRQLEQQNIKIASQSEKLTQMNQLKDRVISVMSHDLRSPINSLYSIVEMFNAKQLSHEEMEALFPELGKTVNSVSILLENILAWVKSQMIQDSSLNVTQFNLHSAIEEIVKLYQPSASQKHLTIKNLILPSLEIKTDKNDLELIIKFSNLGQTIELCAEQKDKEWVISVKDNGVGMTEAELQKLFNPDKLHTSIGTNKEKGTGLGLLLVKVSVEKLKGKLSIDSQKGMGSQFNISLPVE